jgi:hypothetical protein
MTINAVPGDPLANSYVTVEQATAFLQERLHVEAWYTGDPEEAITLPHRREAALMQATRLLDEQMGWYGRPATMTQALAWPQVGQVDAMGRPVDPSLVPANVQRATAYYALTLLEAEEIVQAATVAAATGEGLIKSKKIGETTITYQDAPSASTSTSTATMTHPRIPNEVWLLLKPYGMVPGFGMIPLLRT